MPRVSIPNYTLPDFAAPQRASHRAAKLGGFPGWPTLLGGCTVKILGALCVRLMDAMDVNDVLSDVIHDVPGTQAALQSTADALSHHGNPLEVGKKSFMPTHTQATESCLCTVLILISSCKSRDVSHQDRYHAAVGFPGSTGRTIM